MIGEAVSVVQYDTNRVGGITMAHKINALCEAYGVPVIPQCRPDAHLPSDREFIRLPDQRVFSDE